jgi:hypothetical protein
MKQRRHSLDINEKTIRMADGLGQWPKTAQNGRARPGRQMNRRTKSKAGSPGQSGEG